MLSRVFKMIGGVVVALSLGVLVVPLVLAGRVGLGVVMGEAWLVGVPKTALPGVLAAYNRTLQQQRVALVLHEVVHEWPLADLGLRLDLPVATKRVVESSWYEWPERTVPVTIDESIMDAAIQAKFADIIKGPRNASLQLRSDTVAELVPGQRGEGVDLTALSADVRQAVAFGFTQQPLPITLVDATPSVTDDEITRAQVLSHALLRQGLTLASNDATWAMKPVTVRRLLEFVPVEDSERPSNQILGLQLNPAGLAQYLTTTIGPVVESPAQNARFARNSLDGQITQFAKATRGRTLRAQANVAHINQQLQQFSSQVQLEISETIPPVENVAAIESLGVPTLLARGETNFAGSPVNRRHNIEVGTARYHGLLIPPQAEFSFNEHLGPVDAEHGFKPELVIKQNVTTPEYGGGLCQVSTTIFRSAVFSGLDVSQRRNHAYAVAYYGTPGFDATIYPPYTDLRFINNTPGYILIQAQLVGTSLAVEFWGTNDGRTVVVDGPHPYNRRPDGAVSATLTQTVSRQEQVVLERTFVSRYRSPKLFPKVSTVDLPVPPLSPAP